MAADRLGRTVRATVRLGLLAYLSYSFAVILASAGAGNLFYKDAVCVLNIGGDTTAVFAALGQLVGVLGGIILISAVGPRLYIRPTGAAFLLELDFVVEIQGIIQGNNPAAVSGSILDGKCRRNKINMTDYVEVLLTRNIHKITLQLTQDCNFICSYCPYCNNDGSQRKYSNQTMSYETAKNAINFLHQNSVDLTKVNIGFYGGEPLLQFNLMKKLIEYAELLFDGKKISFSITTNATLLTKEKIEYFSNHNVDLTISIDGPKEINDKNRKFKDGLTGTFETVRTKLKLIEEILPKDKLVNIGINMVLDPQNDFDSINSLFDDPIFDKVDILFQ